ncbi:GAF domain-containing protein [Pedobacter hiemivivus]|uniref:GAF domain-containing protein n=2 Tax=Pedobacter hiemivivus TaxID=2530454 RepID=A0A4U1G8M4_9SPHI|nr:GAF domain-containing protein [Pedobacter hiemivivus]
MTLISTDFQTPFQMQFSFEPLIQKLEQLAETENEWDAMSKKQLLERVLAFPELREGIFDTAIFENQAPLITDLLADYFPVGLTHNEIKAVGLPYNSLVFNLTERFKSILKEAGQEFEFSIRDFDDQQLYIMSCCIILNKFYGTRLDFGKPLFYDIPTSEGIMKHYRILYNADFLDIIPTDKAVPLTSADVNQLIDNYDELSLWQAKFPLDSYVLKGFTIITLFDATIENAVSIFKGKLIDLESEAFQQSLNSIFSSIFRLRDLNVGYVMFCHEGNRFSEMTLVQRKHSIVLPTRTNSAEDFLVLEQYWQLISDRQYLAISDVGEFVSKHPGHSLAGPLLDHKSGSLILAPVIKNGIILGVLEVASPHIKLLNSITAHKLEVVMPYLSDKLEKIAIEMESNIQAMIQQKYTSLHPSVSWKFRQAIKAGFNEIPGEGQTIEQEITFENVIPLYGQVDVKGSSKSRNLSVEKDLELQLSSALSLIQSIKEDHSTAHYARFYKELNELLVVVKSFFRADTEQQVIEYLGGTIQPWLMANRADDNEAAIEEYTEALDKQKGTFHTYRRKFDQTISQINGYLADVLDEEQVKAQRIFPHYFERFKSDGIEHNLYVGQSISPKLKFDPSMLSDLRIWQLRTMCKMEYIHHSNLSTLPYPLEVSSLILVYSSAIAIRFRLDEKRFDVDGTYNARFEMVKKRIDKAHIRHTTERISKPGTITIVYTSEGEQREYLKYIGILQQEGKLSSEVESFEVEDLQDITGLKALRVGVIFAF